VGEWMTPDVSVTCTSQGGEDPSCSNCGTGHAQACNSCAGDPSNGDVQTSSSGSDGSSSASSAARVSLPILAPGARIPTGFHHVVQIDVVGGVATAVSCSVGVPCVAEPVSCAAQVGLTCVAEEAAF
jgi:hypothetical protein